LGTKGKFRDAKNLVERFKEEYRKKSRQARIENYRELPGRYTAKMLYGWDDKRFDQEYWERLKRN